MPSSRVSVIPHVISVILQLRPRSILDVGVGFGKWGYLFREFTDIVMARFELERYPRSGWKTRIDGIEGYEPYLHDAHRYIYDNIYLGDAAVVLPTLAQYDVIFFGDIIEHFPLEQGKKLLQTALEHCDMCVMLTTPKFETQQADVYDNSLEQHRSLWRPKHFRELGKCKIVLPACDQATYVVAYARPGSRPFHLKPQRYCPRSLLYRIARRLIRPLQHLLRSKRS